MLGADRYKSVRMWLQHHYQAVVHRGWWSWGDWDLWLKSLLFRIVPTFVTTMRGFLISSGQHSLAEST